MPKKSWVEENTFFRVCKVGYSNFHLITFSKKRQNIFCHLLCFSVGKTATIVDCEVCWKSRTKAPFGKEQTLEAKLSINNWPVYQKHIQFTLLLAQPYHKRFPSKIACLRGNLSYLPIACTPEAQLDTYIKVEAWFLSTTTCNVGSSKPHFVFSWIPRAQTLPSDLVALFALVGKCLEASLALQDWQVPRGPFPTKLTFLHH